jgi:hypothetical protein
MFQMKDVDLNELYTSCYVPFFIQCIVSEKMSEVQFDFCVKYGIYLTSMRTI